MAKKIRGTAKKAAAALEKAAIVDIAPQTITATPTSGSKPARVNVATTITVQSVPAPAAPAAATVSAPPAASAISHNTSTLLPTETSSTTTAAAESDKALTDEISGLSNVTKKLAKANTSMVVKAIDGNTVNIGKKLDIISGNISGVVRTVDKDMLETGKLFSSLGISMADSSRDTKDKLIKELERMTELLDTPSISTEERLETIKHREDLLEALGKLEFKQDKEKEKVKGGGWLTTIVAISGLLIGFIVGFVSTVLKDLGRIKFIKVLFDKITGVFTGIGKFFTGIGDKVKNLGNAFKNSGFAKWIDDAVKMVKNFFKPVTTYLGGIKDAFKALFDSPVIKSLIKTIQNSKIAGMIKSVMGFFGSTGAGVGAIGGRLNSLGGIFSKFMKFGKLLGSAVGKLFLPFKIIMGVFDGIKGAMEGYATGGIMGAIKGAIIGVIDGLVGFLWDIPMWALKHLLRAVGLEDLANWLDKNFSFKQVLGGLYDILYDYLMIIPNAFKGMFTGMIEGWGEGGPLGALTGLFSGFFGGLWSGIKKVFFGIMKFFNLKGILNAIIPRDSWAGRLLAKTGVYDGAEVAANSNDEPDDLKKDKPREDETPTPEPQTPTPEPQTPTPTGVKTTRELSRAEYRDMMIEKERAELDARGGPVKIRTGKYDYAGEDIKPVETNSTGAEINQISKSNKEMQSTPIIIAAPAPASGGGGKGSTNTNNVSSVTYQNNNIPDRSFTFNRGALAAY